MDARVTVLFSGGVDSTACIHLLSKKGLTVRGLFIDYGQSAALREKAAVIGLASSLDIQVDMLKLQSDLHPGAGEITGRNAFLLATALLHNGSGSGLVAIAVHAGVPYFDCSQEFINSFADLYKSQTDGRVVLLAPFLTWTKADIYEYFAKENLPFDETYSCEAGQQEPCGECLSCQDRQRYRC